MTNTTTTTTGSRRRRHGMTAAALVLALALLSAAQLPSAECAPVAKVLNPRFVEVGTRSTLEVSFGGEAVPADGFDITVACTRGRVPFASCAKPMPSLDAKHNLVLPYFAPDTFGPDSCVVTVSPSSGVDAGSVLTTGEFLVGHPATLTVQGLAALVTTKQDVAGVSITSEYAPPSDLHVAVECVAGSTQPAKMTIAKGTLTSQKFTYSASSEESIDSCTYKVTSADDGATAARFIAPEASIITVGSTAGLRTFTFTSSGPNGVYAPPTEVEAGKQSHIFAVAPSVGTAEGALTLELKCTRSTQTTAKATWAQGATEPQRVYYVAPTQCGVKDSCAWLVTSETPIESTQYARPADWAQVEIVPARGARQNWKNKLREAAPVESLSSDAYAVYRPQVCGNGEVEGDEECDAGASSDQFGCTSACAWCAAGTVMSTSTCVELQCDGSGDIVPVNKPANLPCTSQSGNRCSNTGVCTYPPSIMIASPTIGSVNVNVATLIDVAFSRPIDHATATASTDGTCVGNVQLSSDDFQTCVAFTTAVGTPATSISFKLTPLMPLAYATAYRLKVTTGLTSDVGVAMISEYINVGSWTTQPSPP